MIGGSFVVGEEPGEEFLVQGGWEEDIGGADDLAGGDACGVSQIPTNGGGLVCWNSR